MVKCTTVGRRWPRFTVVRWVFIVHSLSDADGQRGQIDVDTTSPNRTTTMSTTTTTTNSKKRTADDQIKHLVSIVNSIGTVSADQKNVKECSRCGWIDRVDNLPQCNGGCGERDYCEQCWDERAFTCERCEEMACPACGPHVCTGPNCGIKVCLACTNQGSEPLLCIDCETTMITGEDGKEQS